MSFSTATGIALIDSRIKSGILTLPSASDIPGRILYVKDSQGNFGISSLTLSTTVSQSFENGINTYTLNDTGGYSLLASDGGNRWMQISGTSNRQTTTSNARISTLEAGFVSTGFAFTNKILARSTLELNTKYEVGPGTRLDRGSNIFTNLNLSMNVYDLPISTFSEIANTDTLRVNILSTGVLLQNEFTLPIDFGAYPANKKFYSTLTSNTVDLKTRSLTLKLWGTGGNAAYKGTFPVRGGAGTYMKITEFYPSRRFGFFGDLDPIGYTLYLQPADTTNLGFPNPTVESALGQFGQVSNISGRGAVHGPVFRVNYQGSNYDVFSPGAGGGGVFQYTPPSFDQVVTASGQDGGTTLTSNTTSISWNPAIGIAGQGFGIGGGGGIIGSCNANLGGGAGISLCNVQRYCYPWNAPGYVNGKISITSANNPNSTSDPDYLIADVGQGGWGFGGSGNSDLGIGNPLGSNGLAVIDQPYDALNSNLTFVCNGSFTSIITAPVTFRLTGPDGLYLALNGIPIINDWTSCNQMHSLSNTVLINSNNTYSIDIKAYNATTSNNTLRFEYFVADRMTLGDEVALNVSSGVFLNNASTTFTSSVTANSMATKTFRTETFLGQTFQLVPSNVTATTPFYVASAGTFADTLVVGEHLSVGKSVYASSLVVSSIFLNNTFSDGSTQKLSLYESTLTIDSLELMTPINAGRLVVNSTIAGLGSFGYLSTAGIGSVNFVSTVEGLGSSGYLSSLNRIVDWNFVSSPSLTSSIVGLGSAGYVSTASGFDNILRSTVNGLGTVGYLSTTSLTSTVRGLGSSGYVSSTGLISTVEGLGSIGYVSSTGLISTVEGLGSIGYASSIALYSTVQGIGSLGYLSTFMIPSSISTGRATVFISSGSTIVFGVHSGEAGRIISTGRFGIGDVSTPLATVDINGSVFVRSTLYVSSGSIVIGKPVGSIPNAELDINGIATMESIFVNNQGTFGGTVTAQNFATPSDFGLKENIKTISSGFGLIEKTRGVEFTWKGCGLHDYGYIAQEVATYLPEAIISTGSTMYVKYDTFLPFITESIKSLQSEISDLKNILRRNGLA